MKKETRDVFIAADGAEFETEHACKVHEAMAAENDIIDEFLKTKAWNVETNKGYAPRTLTTFRNLMMSYVAFKLAQEDGVDVEQETDEAA